MTEIIKMAGQLGELIKEDSITKALLAAKDNYEHDEYLNRLFTEYDVQQKAMTMEYSKEEVDNDFIAAIEKRIQQLTEEIMSHPLFLEYQKAEEDYNDLMKLVNDEINFRVTGKRSCTGDCSSCGGCSTPQENN